MDQPKKEKKSSQKAQKSKRSEKAPHKSGDVEAWKTWYREEIMEMIKKGKSHDDIKKELKITHLNMFLDNEK